MVTVQKQGMKPTGVEVRHCKGLEEFQACLRLQKRVWGGEEVDVVPLPVFVVAAETGGQVLGAFQGARLVGFTLALPAHREGKPYLHSHMTAVHPEFQDQGIGRRLKLLQRQDALRRGLDLVEWTFDPLELKNAYFNLMRLGVIVRRYLPDHYGRTTSPLHGGLPTDRLLAEWWLRSPRVEAVLAGRGSPGTSPGKEEVRILVPKMIDQLKRNDPSQAARVQRQVADQFQEWFGRDFIVTGIDITPKTGTYLLEPYALVQGLSA